eukprot:SAG11_NODE_19712_length_460_cov_1.326870_1_plen_60_part_01
MHMAMMWLVAIAALLLRRVNAKGTVEEVHMFDAQIALAPLSLEPPQELQLDLPSGHYSLL